MKKIKELELIETEHADTIVAYEDFDDKTMKKIYLVDKINELVKVVNQLSEVLNKQLKTK